MFVPIWLVLPRCEATNSGVPDAISTYSNGSVQIQVGLELAEKPLRKALRDSGMPNLSRQFNSQGRGRGVQSTGVSHNVRETRRDKFQSFPVQEKLFKTHGIWRSRFSRDLSQVVGRTPRDTPVPFCTCTSAWPKQWRYHIIPKRGPIHVWRAPQL